MSLFLGLVCFAIALIALWVIVKESQRGQRVNRKSNVPEGIAADFKLLMLRIEDTFSTKKRRRGKSEQRSRIDRDTGRYL
ncbi:hypothetical protein [Pseudanabaena yagii]|uniref:Uncharacterized protein n=1 Tax=Pseudanabaena yagii GIHE-NHR1 TaxID=2722753 RepID=A0ABX1LY46_9CYAN|nr:hypothetical protein [Pseudanabaena yagii]NMF60163.1 hypothetical protein [Pseudanabaena yagii GIHE-NHR1]